MRCVGLWPSEYLQRIIAQDVYLQYEMQNDIDRDWDR